MSDVGDGGSYWKSDGTIWRPLNGSCAVSPRIKYPVIVAPSGTINIGSSGTITLGSSLTSVFSGGMWLYLPNIATTPAITAGFHFVIFSTDLIGTIYGTGTGTALPTNTPSATPLTISAGTTYSGDLNEITVYSCTLPAGCMSTMGELFFRHGCFKFGGTSAVSFAVKLAGTSIFSQSFANTVKSANSINSIKNQASAARQISALTTSASTLTSSTQSPVLTTVDTSVAFTYSITIDMATATDWAGIFDVDVELHL